MSTSTKSDIDQRVRKVAIVIQSLDSATAKSLLAQLPSDMARQVKLAMVKLGSVTAEEREEAMNGLQGLLSHPAEKKRRGADSTSEQPIRSESPKSELPRYEAFQIDHRPSGSFPRDLASDISDIETPWLAWAPAALANFLANERPTVIATVLNQLSPERAKLLLDHLPVETAGATLAAIPSLFLVDPSILTDILGEIERKLPKQPPIQTTANIAGIAKLSAIVDQFQGPQRQAWLKAIAQQNSDIASQLGWNASDVELEPVKTSAAVPAIGNGSVQVDVSHSNPSMIDSAYADQPPVILPIRTLHDAIASKLAPEESASMAIDLPVDPIQRIVVRNFDDLLRLTDGDLVTLLHSCDRETVLRAIAGSGSQMSKRIERLIPAKDLKKFRSYIKKLPSSYSRAGQIAQETVLEQASRLMEAGRISSLSGFTFLAAA